MSKNDSSTSALHPTPFKKGYQHILLKEGYIPDQQRGHQPVTSQRVPANPPSNPPNQGTGGKSGRNSVINKTP